MIEELYFVERPEEAWLKEILSKACQFLDRGAGLGGVLYDLAPGEDLDVQQMIGMNLTDGWSEVGQLLHTASEFVRDQERGYRTLQCATLHECVRGALTQDAVIDVYRRWGLAGVTMINGLNPSGEGCALYIFSTRNDHLSIKKRELLCRLSSHIATANRLRCKLQAAGLMNVPTTADAVLTTSGKLEHARGDAQSKQSRESIKKAFAARAWARGSARVDPERASRVWKGLVGAKWSLVDYVESDGKRYVLAQENPMVVAGFASFSVREREVLALALQGRPNKLIAYELGVANATVRVLMSRAAHKVGARSRRELLEKCQVGFSQ